MTATMTQYDFKMGETVAKAIVAGNAATIDVAIMAAVMNDKRAAQLLSMSDPLMDFFVNKRSTQTKPVLAGGHWALFKPRFGADIAMLARNGFKLADLEKAMLKELPLIQSIQKMSPVLARQISRSNDVIFDAFVACAESRDPLAPMLLGIKESLIEDYLTIVKSKMMAAFTEIGYPIFGFRFVDHNILMEICDSGFMSPNIILEFMKES